MGILILMVLSVSLAFALRTAIGKRNSMNKLRCFNNNLNDDN